MRNTVPLSTVVLNEALVGSAKPSLSTGKPLVDHTTQDDAPGLFEMTLVAISSTSTLARPLSLWPVTTRRIFKLIRTFLPLGFVNCVSGEPRVRRGRGNRRRSL